MFKMPSIDIYTLKQLKLDKIYPVFIETGTLFGETIFNMEPIFSELYTIDISEKYHNFTKSLYKGNKINFILGDSSDIFLDLLPSIKHNTIFFLDGHWSAGDTGKGKKDCPLVEECERINKLFKHDAILIIDDYRLFGKGPNKSNEICNWEDISKDKLLSILKDRITDVYHLPSYLDKEDRLVVHIEKL